MTDIPIKHLKAKVAALPASPGVYLMKDAKGKIIYVGKAVALRSRVGSYFQEARDHSYKTGALVQRICDFEVILSQSEKEALLLERSLIRHHAPMFNILLRDDREYPFLRVDFKAPWPRIEVVRRRKDDGATYLGPFSHSGALRQMVSAAGRIFPFIRCSPYEFAQRKRVCNYYDMKMCLGPCVLPVTRDDYVAIIHDALAFLQGRRQDVIRQIKLRMQDAAKGEQFELAAVYRDQLDAFSKTLTKQVAVTKGVEDADIIGLCQDQGVTAFQIMQVRDEELLGGDTFVLKSPIQTPVEALQEFLLQYYETRPLPDLILLPNIPGDGDALRESLLAINRDPIQGKALVASAQRGERKSLLDMAEKNARFSLEESQRQDLKQSAELENLQEKLGLALVPRRMECIDISNWQESAIVASNVCFINGKPDKSKYRHYVIKDVVGSPDDYTSITEVVRRRLERAARDEDAPDLLVIDGGLGQLHAAMAAAKEFPDQNIHIVSIAKARSEDTRGVGEMVSSKDPTYSDERIFSPDRETPLILVPGSSEFRLLTSLRDEAHRFAITHHRKRRSKQLHGSLLEEVPGIGPAMRKRLLDEFGGLDGLRKTSFERLRAVKGLKEASAVALFALLQTEAPPS